MKANQKKVDVSQYGDSALKFFVTNNNKFKRLFHDEDSWDAILTMVEENFIYTEIQLSALKQKFDKSIKA